MRRGRLVVGLTLWLIACGEALVITDPQPVDAPVDRETAPSTPASDARAPTVPTEANIPAEASTTIAASDGGCAPESESWLTYNAYRDASACRPLECLRKDTCPATWAETVADKFYFCAANAENFDFDAFRSTGTCGGWLRYWQFHFDGGPSVCLYDPVSTKLVGFAAFDGKAGYAEWTCGFRNEDFTIKEDCLGLGCSLLEAPDGGVCPPGVKQCTGLVPETCNSAGRWDSSDSCPYTCTKGDCIGVCVPGTKDCDGLVPRFCSDEGAWIALAPCTHACGAGTCGGTCDGTCSCVGGVCPATTLAADARDLVIDTTNIYWSTSGSPSGAIMKMPLAGGPPVTLASVSFLTGQLAVDSTNVYWAEWPAGAWGSGATGALKRVPLNGGTTTTLASTAEGVLGVAVDSTAVYWSRGVIPTTSSTLMKLPLAGGASTAIATSSATKLLVDGTSIYWVDNTAAVGGDILKMPRGGGAIVRLASGQGQSVPFTIDAARIYWASGNAIASMPLDGGTITTHATGQYQTGAIAVDGTNIYWTNMDTHGGIMMVPISGGTPTTLASAATSWSIVADGKYVYWSGAGLNRSAR